MAIDLNLETISSGFNTSKINRNFQAIDQALQNAVSRSGDSPNQMNTDFDMNSNDILNAKDVFAERVYVGGTPIVPGDISVDPDALIPVGGTDGQVLTKQSTTDYDVAWEDVPEGIPPGGTDGQVLTKQSADNYDVEWETPAVAIPTGGTFGQILTKQSSTDFDADWETLPQFNVKWYGAVGDGVTNDTAAILSAETARAAVGGELVFPPGTYLTDGTAINRANGGGWRGVGNARLLARSNSVILIDVAGAVVSSTAAKVFYVENIEFHFNSKTGVTGYREAAPYFTRISRCKFNRLQYSCIMTGPNAATQTGWVNISDVDQVGEGSWLFRAYDNTRYIFNININNFNQQGTGAAPWTGVAALFHFQRAVSVYLNNINAASLDGGARGVYMQGDCQGIFLNNVIIGWPTYGVHAVTWTDGIKPAYVYINNCGMDQATVAGFDIIGRTWRITNSNSTNGYLRSSTGPAVHIQATATDIVIRDFLAAYMNHDGVKVEDGATKVILSGITSENNNQNAGGNYDMNLTSCSWLDVILEGRNYIGSAGVNATGQRVVNGTTSKEVSRNTGSAATTAVTTQEDLMTYSIPANTLKPGQKVRLTAWGLTAANANTKTVRLWFGANSVVDHSGTWNNLPWRLQSEIYITGTDTQEYSSVGWPQANVQSVRQGTATNDDGVAITVKATGQNGTASAGDITCQGFTVEIID